MYKCAHGLNPLYLNELFINKDTPYNLRDSNRLQQLEFRTVRYGFKSFRYYGLRLWNALPTEVKQSDNLYHWNITSCHGPHLHAMLRIISRGVSGLATDSPCGVWGRGWTTCLLHDSPLFGSHFKMRVGMWVWSDISCIYHFLHRFTVSCMTGSWNASSSKTMICLFYIINIMAADVLATQGARAQFQKRSARDRLRYDPVILISRSHSTNADHDRLIRSRNYETKQFIANWIMTKIIHWEI